MEINLRIPGPTPIPPQVREALSRQMINHRGPEFAELLARVTKNLQTVFQTKNDVLLFPSAGTGMMEATVVNTCNVGDTVIVVSIGTFGERYANIAKIFGLSVVTVIHDSGHGAHLDEIKKALDENPAAKAVFVTHNETSTGVTNDLEKIAKLVTTYDVLLIVDAESSLGSIPVKIDEWGIDVAFTASQKGFMCPPGLSMVSISEKAWKAVNESKIPKFYFNFLDVKRSFLKGQTPYTPALSLLFALDVALTMMLSEGLEHVFARHKKLGEYTRAEIKKMGLTLFPYEEFASNTVTAVTIPERLDGKKLLETARVEHGLVLGGGQGDLAGKIFRIGHMGWVTEKEISAAITIIKQLIS